MNRKDICDLTTLFGSLAIVFQVFAILDLIQSGEGFLASVPTYLRGETTNMILLLIQQVILLLFYSFLTVMAYKLRKI